MTPVTMGLDAPRVTHEEALRLMVHHLELAAMYFEATPSNNEHADKMITAWVNKRTVNNFEPPAIRGIRAFVKEMRQVFEEMK